MTSSTNVLTVSQYLDNINKILYKEKAKIIGEVSGIQDYPGRSYMYFSIKDGKDGSTIRCFMWKKDYKISSVELKDGLEVILQAYPAVYKPNGGLSLQVETIELVGEGALQMAYQKLKKKLELEGLFSPLRKKTLPEFPHKIGVITSKSGAVINDFLTNIGKFGYKIYFVDSKVEGAEAVFDLISAIDTLKKFDLDVLVVMRGGGSLESFQAFNNEVLVRAVANFPFPVITGIGHDKDIPIISLVSDRNVSTPTAVANLLNESWSKAGMQINISWQKISSKYLLAFNSKTSFVESSISKMEKGILFVRENAIRNWENVVNSFFYWLKSHKQSIIQFEKSLEILNPKRPLLHGYSIVKIGGRIVKSKSQAKTGDRLDITLSDGIIESEVV
jgi:exodeoxyribonuclease VII large subunit